MKSIVYSCVKWGEECIWIVSRDSFARDLASVEQLIWVLSVEHDEDMWEYLRSATGKELADILLEAKRENELMVFYLQ